MAWVKIIVDRSRSRTGRFAKGGAVGLVTQVPHVAPEHQDVVEVKMDDGYRSTDAKGVRAKPAGKEGGDNFISIFVSFEENEPRKLKKCPVYNQR